MHRYLKARFLASALGLAAIPLAFAPTAAHAEVGISIGFNYFHDNLSNYGDWVYSDRWGRVWRPDVDADFRPYSNGHWAYTDDYGWYWVSREPFADITYHYGRWINDPDDGWLWIPGYVWSPAWVAWRSNGNVTGWMPLPPTEAFLNGDESSYDISDDDDYGYRNWYPDYNERNYASLWVFVNTRHIGDRDYHRYAISRPRFANVFRQTRNVTNYRVENDHVVNRGLDLRAIQRAGGRVQVQRASVFVTRPQLITRVDAGRQIQIRMRQETPHGTGRPNSAPQLTPQQIQTLSPTIRTRGNKPTNLFTRTTVEKAHGQGRPDAQNPQKPGMATPPNAAIPTPGTPAGNMREDRRHQRDQSAPAVVTTPPAVVRPEMQKPQPPVTAQPETPRTPDGNMRENRRRDREQVTPNGAPSTAAPETNDMRPHGRKETQPEIPGAIAPHPATPPVIDRQAPGKIPDATPDQADKHPGRDQMRKELREPAGGRAREQLPTTPPAEIVRPQATPALPAAPAEVRPPRERAMPPTPPAEVVRPQAAPKPPSPPADVRAPREPAAPPATSEPRQIQRGERPAKEDRSGHEDRAGHDDKKDKDKKDEATPQ